MYRNQVEAYLIKNYYIDSLTVMELLFDNESDLKNDELAGTSPAVAAARIAQDLRPKGKTND